MIRLSPMPILSRRAFFTRPRPQVVSQDANWVRVHRTAMACRFEITLDSRDARLVPTARVALNQIDRLEAQLTVFRDTSELVDVNRRAAAEPVAVDDSLFELLARSERISQQTDGAFDITTTPLSRCWGFLRREGRVPTQVEIDTALAHVGMQHVELDHHLTTVRFRRPGLELNLGAIGKGYALDRVGRMLRDAGVYHALFSAGRSSMLAIGGRQRGWDVEIVSPRLASPIARVWLKDAALGTSGAGEQFVLVDGRRYGHVLDPRTGHPAQGVLSASVICSSAADADALSTAFLVAGPALAQRYCDAHPGVLALITPDDGSGRRLVIGSYRGAEVADA
jgi:thiamine biosynthesis lipoprotein